LNFLKNRIENKDDIETIIYNHTHLFPRIFKKWNTLLREKELSRLLWILTRLYFDPFQLSIDDLNVSYSLKLKGTLLNMEISKREQMVDFINKANLALTEWIRDKGIESKISVWDLTPEISKKEFPSISRLLQKIIQIHKSRPLVMAALIQGDYVADEEYDEYEFYRKQISESTKDLVSFQFYSLLRFDINQPLWNKISKNQEFVQWYSNWLNAIIESEEENLKLLKTISV
jgi:hypothetical protein